MKSVSLREYRLRFDAGMRAPPHLRKLVTTRDERGRPCKELWAYGKCYTRIVDFGHGQCALFADRGGHVLPDQGKISFSTWDEPERVFGDGKPHGMPMVGRRP